MDPRGHPGPLPDGATCTACGAAVPTERMTILARRDDLAFVELDCAACGSTALGLLIEAATPDGAPVLDVAGDATTPTEAAPTAKVRPISAADVEAIRADLAAWDGDLVGWLDALEDSGRRGSVVDR
jgi:hypothetical protein